MATLYKFHMVPISKITVGERQRQVFDEEKIQELADSISRFGLINPITINKNGLLVAGERRLRACIKNGMKEISCHFVEELDEYQLKVMELEENVQREDLTWKEECQAILDYHTLRSSKDPDWTAQETSDALGISERTCGRKLSVARALRSGDKAISTCQSLSAAFNVIERQYHRQLDTDMAHADFIERMPVVTVKLPASAAAPVSREEPAFRPASADIHNMRFQDFVSSYSGRPFNVIHCDFPYGINMDKSKQGEIASYGTYEDSDETYWSLIDCLLSNKEKIISPSCHIYFWFSMKKYTETVKCFTDAGFRVNPTPMIWVKVDNIGMIPDPKRGPKQIYETCLLMSLGDRFIIRPVVNVASVAANKHTALHLSEKPRVVLQQFLSMAVDQTINFLDPTCGAGSSLVAAELLGAASVTGVEIEKRHCDVAISQLNNVRVSPKGRASRVTVEDDLELDL